MIQELLHQIVIVTNNVAEAVQDQEIVVAEIVDVDHVQLDQEHVLQDLVVGHLEIVVKKRNAIRRGNTIGREGERDYLI